MDQIALPPGLPGGFRFHPTDEELITCYLKPKLLGTDPDVDSIIAEVDFYNFDPWELPDKSKIKSRDRMWLFFCRRDYQNANSQRVKRTTKTGFWKTTGKERVIKDQDTKACIGKKRILLFHRGSAASGRGERTDWVMHEYFVESDHTFPDQSPYVLCRLKIRGNDMADTPGGNGGERGDNIPEVENPVKIDPNPSRKQGLNSSATSFEDDVELTASLIPKKEEFFPRMITSLKRCFDFCFYSRTSSEKN